MDLTCKENACPSHLEAICAAEGTPANAGKQE